MDFNCAQSVPEDTGLNRHLPHSPLPLSCACRHEQTPPTAESKEDTVPHGSACPAESRGKGENCLEQRSEALQPDFHFAKEPYDTASELREVL